MKNLKKCLIFAAYSLIAATALTSCLDSDDGNYISTREMTDVERAEYLSAISGEYDGKMKYTYTDSRTGRTYVDSVNVSWIVGTDKKIEIEELPDSIFRHYMDSRSATKAVADTVTTTNDVEFDLGGFFIQTDNNGKVYSKLFTINAKNTEHKFSVVRNDNGVSTDYPVTVKFANDYTAGMDYYSSIGIYDSSKRSVTVQLLLSSVKTESEMRADEVFLLSGKKR